MQYITSKFAFSGEWEWKLMVHVSLYMQDGLTAVDVADSRGHKEVFPTGQMIQLKKPVEFVRRRFNPIKVWDAYLELESRATTTGLSYMCYFLC